MNRRRLINGSLHRFQAHDRRWKLLEESPDPRHAARRRALDWAAAHIRWENFIARRSMRDVVLELVRQQSGPTN